MQKFEKPKFLSLINFTELESKLFPQAQFKLSILFFAKNRKDYKIYRPNAEFFIARHTKNKI